MTDDIDDQEVAQPFDLLELIDQFMYTACDENGAFDIREDPNRMIQMVSREVEILRDIARVFEQALLSRMAEGEKIEIDAPDLFEEGKVVIVRRDGHILIDDDQPESSVGVVEESTYMVRAAGLQDAIYRNDYYTDLYECALASSNMTKEGIASKSYGAKMLSDMLNMFWLDLPDTAAINRTPFNELCDLLGEV